MLDMPRPIRGRLTRLLAGAHPALPGPLDGLAERWARLAPRRRSAVVLLAVVLAVGGVQARIRVADDRWGGTPVRVLVAERHLGAGEIVTDVARRALPPAAVPPDALGDVDDQTTLAIALPEGSVLTKAHIDPRGPAAGLADGLRALPVPVEPGWGVTSGAWVDVWVLGTGEGPTSLVARSRPVLEVRGDDFEQTALVGLDADEVTQATRGLAAGGLLLTHAPPPGTDG